MTLLSRLYDQLIRTLAVAAAALIVAVFVMVVVDVVLRTTGQRPPTYTSALSEYALLYMTMLAAPWMVRERGHVRIDSFVDYLPERWQVRIERMILIVCILLCGVATFYSARFAMTFWSTGALDIRSIAIPRAWLFVPLATGFGLCGTEFTRLLLRRERLRAVS